MSRVVLLDKVGQLETVRLRHTIDIFDATLQQAAEYGLARA